MIVLAAGLPKAGTSWYFNLANTLISTSGGQDARIIRRKYFLRFIQGSNCDIDNIHLPHLRTSPPSSLRLLYATVPHFFGNSFAVKSHSHPTTTIQALISAGIIKATYIYRDPRDAAVSAFEHGQRFRKEGITQAFAHLNNIEESILFIKKYLPAWDKWMNYRNALFIRYEDLINDPFKQLEQLARFLNFDVTADKLHKIVSSYNRKKSTDNKTENDFTILHFNKGISGRFRDVMNKKELEFCEIHFGDYIRKMGYPEY